MTIMQNDDKGIKTSIKNSIKKVALRNRGQQAKVQTANLQQIRYCKSRRQPTLGRCRVRIRTII